MVRQVAKVSLGLFLAALTTIAAQAHTGHGSTLGFADGIGHPLSGIDHILAMVAVGMFAAQLGGRAVWLMPGAFIAMMAVGGALGISGIQLPFVELGIAASVIVLGALVALQSVTPTSIAMGLTGFFALFHGHAHGTEMPTDASCLSYAAGFSLATATLHVTGVALGRDLARLGSGYSRRVFQVGGSAMAVAGLGILGGYI
jgi:urease accessory protein